MFPVHLLIFLLQHLVRPMSYGVWPWGCLPFQSLQPCLKPPVTIRVSKVKQWGDCSPQGDQQLDKFCQGQYATLGSDQQVEQPCQGELARGVGCQTLFGVIQFALRRILYVDS